jgi:hypothetical protein
MAVDSCQLFGAGGAWKPGGGSWADSSDSRIKIVLGDYGNGLASILTLNPKRYVYRGNETPYGQAPSQWAVAPPPVPEGEPTPKDEPGAAPYANSPHYDAATKQKEFIGLIAQECETAFPEMVTRRNAMIDGEPVADLRDLDTNALIYALVNSVKELAARLEAVEASLTR